MPDTDTSPITDRPVTDGPVTDQPVTDQSTTDEPDLHDVVEGDVVLADEQHVPVHPTFAELGVGPAVVEALAAVGITHAFPIQALTLPVALSGHDIIGQAKTGTGKTLGFGIPIIERVVGPDDPGVETLAQPGAPQALVVVPTRELAVQVAGDLTAAAARRSVRVLTVYGGRAYEPQVEALKRGVEVVVGTPGRLLDLANQGLLSLAHARTVVLDEADEMLDLGFLPDVEKLLAMTPTGRQTMLFSATMPGAVVALARRYMVQATHIRAADPHDAGVTLAAIKQVVLRAHSMDKVEMLSRILQARGRGLTMVFARTKRTVANVAEQLADNGFAAAAIHGDLGQGAREQAMRAFRSGKVDVLVATDVAARGIDVDDVTHVVNYQCPEDDKTYLHRIGRTGRAGKTGTAVTFVDWDDVPRWGLIARAVGHEVLNPPETYSSSLHLFADLDIPEGTTGRLPRAQRTREGLGAEQVEDLGETGARARAGAGRTGSARPRAARDAGGTAMTRGGSGRSGAGSAEPAPRSERPPRERRRTRGGSGSTVSGAAPNGAAQSGAAQRGAAQSGAAPTGAPAEHPTGETGERTGRRRRRGGRGRGAAAGAAAETTSD